VLLLTKPLTRLGDLSQGHGCWPPRPNITASPNIYTNGLPNHRQFDLWDTHCFVGETMLTVNGCFVSFLEIHNEYLKGHERFQKKFFTTSFDIHEEIQTPIVQVFCKEVFELVEIEFEDGTIVKCTPEHLFLLESGVYKMAKDLTEFDNIQNSKFK
jgi:hypothetical protein